MKKILTVTFAAMLFSAAALAQNTSSSYQTALGIGVYPGAITIKHFTQPNRALEGLLYFYNYGVRFTGLYEIHGDINDAAGLKWFLGPGAHLGFWNNDWKDHYPDRNGGIDIGVDGIIGLDYKFKGAPINISVQWQPSFTIASYAYFEGGWGGFALRYTIK